jgi:phage regulator Rha-like protein
MMCPGGDPAIQERWDAMWKWLQAQHRTRADQIKRLQALKQLLREDQEEASSEKRTQA